jgi:hypothetical protein
MRVAVENDGAAICGAMLTLVMQAVHTSGGDGKGLPPFRAPTLFVSVGRVLVTSDFSTNGPIQAGC